MSSTARMVMKIIGASLAFAAFVCLLIGGWHDIGVGCACLRNQLLRSLIPNPTLMMIGICTLERHTKANDCGCVDRGDGAFTLSNAKHLLSAPYEHLGKRGSEPPSFTQARSGHQAVQWTGITIHCTALFTARLTENRYRQSKSNVTQDARWMLVKYA